MPPEHKIFEILHVNLYIVALSWHHDNRIRLKFWRGEKYAPATVFWRAVIPSWMDATV